MRRLTSAEIEEIEINAAIRRAEYTIDATDICAVIEAQCKADKFWLGAGVCRLLDDNFCKAFFEMQEKDGEYFRKLAAMAESRGCDDMAVEFFHGLAVAAEEGYEPDDFLFDFSNKWRDEILDSVI